MACLIELNCFRYFLRHSKWSGTILDEGESYYHKKRALITGWRELWGYEFPFYFVQLANFQNANNNPAGGDGYG